MINFDKKQGFTLAEVMIVLVVLGIVAILTVPSVVKKYFEAQERTKIKKSMAAYDTAINKMVIENDLRSEVALKDWAEPNDCANSVEYFKKVERNGCIFKTSDGVYWDIEDITNPIIAMSENALQDAKENGTDGKKSFKLVTSYDALLGTFRVDDLGFEKKRLEDEILQAGEPTSEIEAKIEELEKLFGFALNIEDKVEQSPFASCDITQNTCVVDGVTYTKRTIVKDKTITSCTYDEEGNLIICKESKAIAGTYWTVNQGGNKSWEEAKNSCTGGTHLATRAELNSLYESGNLKCKDGSVGCIFWAAEEYKPGSAYTIESYYGANSTVRKDYVNKFMQVLCLSK